MSQKLSRSFSTYSKSPSIPGDQTDDYRWSTSLDECFEFSPQNSADGSFDFEENEQPALTGTGRARFCAVRKAAMHTAKALADKCKLAITIHFCLTKQKCFKLLTLTIKTMLYCMLYFCKLII